MLEHILKNRKAQLLSIFLFWSLIAVISASQLYVQLGDRYEGGWMNIFARQIPVWLSWAFLTPVIFYIILERIGKRKFFGLKLFFVHLILALVLSLLNGLLVSVLGIPFYENVEFFSFLVNGFLTRTATNLLIYFMLAMTAYLLIYYKQFKSGELERSLLNLKNEKLENQLNEAKLKALQRQIHPHFLYNTLHSAASLIRTNQNNTAINVIANLSDLLRKSINGGTNVLEALDYELNFLKKYLEIEKIRFGDRLEIKLNIEENLHHVQLPSLIIQPFIENAMKHGLKDEDDGKLIIDVFQKEGRLKINISDNGKGFQNGWESSNGIGISNTIERLDNIYSEDYSIRFENNHAGGAVVSLDLPIELSEN